METLWSEFLAVRRGIFLETHNAGDCMSDTKRSTRQDHQEDSQDSTTKKRRNWDALGPRRGNREPVEPKPAVSLPDVTVGEPGEERLVVPPDVTAEEHADMVWDQEGGSPPVPDEYDPKPPGWSWTW